MKTRLIGDIHGKLYDYQMMIENVERSIQVGDFGIGFAGDYWHDKVNEIHENTNHRFIRGNHDDPGKCEKDMVGYIPDITVENDVMFIGGAWSIDWQWRTPDLNWWEDEELSMSEIEKALEVFTITKPRVMITHDAPNSVTHDMFVKAGLALGGADAPLIKTRTGQMFEVMFELHQPEEWYFGHWHHTKLLERNGTKFQCLGECDFMDVEL